MFTRTHVVLVLALALISAACSSAGGDGESLVSEPTGAAVEVPRGESRDFGPAPDAPDGPLSAEVADAVGVLFDEPPGGFFDLDDADAISVLGSSGDARLGWALTDLLRITRDPGNATSLAAAASELLGLELDLFSAWGEATDHLIAWDTPPPPDYIDIKRSVLTSLGPEWEPFFDPNADIDWRHIAWGGVLIDDRPFDTTDDPCRCIPAADNPEVTTAAEATWLDDDTVVYGVEINGESRAYPRQIMEVREMVNDTLGGRDFGMPYCTLCGSAQVWFTDDLPDGVERPVLRTSGLLARSNKVMFDLNTFSIFDTFLGTALSGPLAEQEIQLNQHSVVTSTWAEWQASHPDTTVLIEDLALGRDPEFRTGRDADGPIFPIGDVDPRLPVQEEVLGVVTASGAPLAFHVPSALATLDRGEIIDVDGISVVADGGGVRAVDAAGADVGGHQAFWFAWSQFHPDTELWPEVS